jgi:hypothetical protein
VSVPVLVLGEGLVDAVIEVLVVGEDNVATDIVQLERTGDSQISNCLILRSTNGGIARGRGE